MPERRNGVRRKEEAILCAMPRCTMVAKDYDPGTRRGYDRHVGDVDAMLGKPWGDQQRCIWAMATSGGRPGS